MPQSLDPYGLTLASGAGTVIILRAHERRAVRACEAKLLKPRSMCGAHGIDRSQSIIAADLRSTSGSKHHDTR